MDHLGALREEVARLPREPGVYLWRGSGGEVLYVGKATDLRARTRQYVQDPSVKGGRLMADARSVEYIAVRNEKEALVLEQTLIKRHRPRYNVRLTDDKQYPYIWLTPGPYPRLVKVHGQPGRGGTWFGPFPDGYGAFHLMQTLNELLPLRRCRTLPTTKCLYYDIGKCVAPCIEACTPQEYDSLVQQARDVLGGRSEGLARAVEARMGEAAARQDFEEAARLRDQLRALQGVMEKQHMAQTALEDRDIAALAAQGDIGVAVLLHQRGGKVEGQSAFTLRGLGGGDEDPLGAFLRGYYAHRGVPRHVAIDASPRHAPALEADLRAMAGHPVRVEAPQRGDKVRWLEVARTNAALRLEQELVKAVRRGEGAAAALQAHLGLDAPPRVVEGFDVSHLAGQHTRAAMVRFVDGEPQKAGYRMFSMRLTGEDAVAAGAGPKRGRGREVDDFASIAEAVRRRYAHNVPAGAATESEGDGLPPDARAGPGRAAAAGSRGQATGRGSGAMARIGPDGVATPHPDEGGDTRPAWPALPDLVVIDGGPGQLAAARAALAALGLEALPLCSLAKREELVHVAGRRMPLKLPRNDAGLQLLQRVRDEAHRFGIQQVRRKATARAAAGPLERIPGIGPKRRQALIKAFGGLEGLRAATVEDLTAMPGITPNMAARVVEVLRQEMAGAPADA